jgi:peptidoglycan/xylan/chitin deacetylase (PgdA/CDA1 family)
MRSVLTKPSRAKVVFGSLLVLASVVIGCSSASSEDEEEVTGAPETNAPEITTKGQLGGGDLPEGQYVLTFDDGPGPRTEELANYLGDKGIVATFFINGKNAPGREAALAAVKARGHVLANHTQNHEDMRQLAGGALYHAVADTDGIIAQYQPQGPWLLRAPYGAWDGRVSDEINGTEMKKYVGSIFWNVGGQLTESFGADWACWGQGVSIDDCAQRYVNEMEQRGRGIILMHDVHSKTIDMAKMIVERIGASHFVSITTAPQIAAAVGGGGGGGGGGTSACGNVDYKGFCEKNKLTWCENGVKKTFECETRNKVCSLKNETEGHDCVVRAPCGGVDYRGSCNGSVLTWCDESGALRSQDCTARGNRCALENEQNGFNCIP